MMKGGCTVDDNGCVIYGVCIFSRFRDAGLEHLTLVACGAKAVQRLNQSRPREMFRIVQIALSLQTASHTGAYKVLYSVDLRYL